MTCLNVIFIWFHFFKKIFGLKCVLLTDKQKWKVGSYMEYAYGGPIYPVHAAYISYTKLEPNRYLYSLGSITNDHHAHTRLKIYKNYYCKIIYISLMLFSR